MATGNVTNENLKEARESIEQEARDWQAILGRKVYRPKDWTVPYQLPSTDIRRTLDERDAFEAGADAMLEALKGEGKYIDASKYPYGLVLNDIVPVQKLERSFRGWLIIIPDISVKPNSPDRYGRLRKGE